MPRETVTNIQTGETIVRDFEYSTEEAAAREAARIASEQKRAQLEQRLTDIPAAENSVPALRAKVNEILAILRGE